MSFLEKLAVELSDDHIKAKFKKKDYDELLSLTNIIVTTKQYPIVESSEELFKLNKQYGFNVDLLEIDLPITFLVDPLDVPVLMQTGDEAHNCNDYFWLIAPLEKAVDRNVDSIDYKYDKLLIAWNKMKGFFQKELENAKKEYAKTVENKDIYRTKQYWDTLKCYIEENILPEIKKWEK